MSPARVRPPVGGWQALRREVRCQECSEIHEATLSHVSPFGGHPVFAVVCPVDWLTDYYTEAALEPL